MKPTCYGLILNQFCEDIEKTFLTLWLILKQGYWPSCTNEVTDFSRPPRRSLWIVFFLRPTNVVFIGFRKPFITNSFKAVDDQIFGGWSSFFRALGFCLFWLVNRLTFIWVCLRMGKWHLQVAIKTRECSAFHPHGGRWWWLWQITIV